MNRAGGGVGKRAAVIAALVLGIGVTSRGAGPAATNGGEEGFVPLFNGRDLEGWLADGSGYEVRDGLLICPKGCKNNLFYGREFSDFVIRFEFRLTRGANNGLAIRAPERGNPSYDGLEIQIIDDDNYFEVHNYRLQPWQKHGSIYGVVAATPGALRPPGEWNEQEVRAVGSRITVVLNGRTIMDADLSQLSGTADGKGLDQHGGVHRRSGRIGFLGHGDEVAFRNIRIRDLAGAGGGPTGR
ncbi:MAG: DUF1080 domain-containing protein [Kiritimatiellae bacterium]|nr:DUF1080 domain-containing protein [Kiritimatiellia bacterium]